jgi:hypothetical protein
MTDREVQAAAARIDALATDGRRCLLAAALGAAVAGASAIAGVGAWIAAVASVPGLVCAAAIRGGQRRALIDGLALEPDAYRIAAVARHGRRAASRRQRKVLATRLESVTRADDWAPLVVPERVSMYRPEFEELKRLVAAPGASIAPPQAVAFRRLLTRCSESALYNADLPPEDLGAALRRIAAGIS